MDKTAEMALRSMAQLTGEATPWKHIGRGAQKLRLLDDADLNIGNAVVVPPIPGFESTAFDFLVPGVQGGSRVLNLNAESHTGCMVTIALAAQLAPLPEPNDQVPGTGPNQITGIIEFGNGGIFNTVEVDIPLGNFRLTPGGGVFVVSNPSTNFDGGTIISLPAGTLRVYARNDAHLIPVPESGTFPAGTIFPNLPGANWFGPNETDTLAALVKAEAVYQPRFGLFSPTRTLTILHSRNNVVTLNDSWRIPPFAKTVRVVRFNPGAVTPMPAVTLDFFAASGTRIEEFIIPAGTNSPVIPVQGLAHAVGVSTTIGTAITDAFVQLIFEIGI